ncbi:hypothetical protein [Sphingomicrobium flavum]|uniref:hypothetical protein n=1 Tax=Sphingomicrobium flavum TaxID=1229164 RepID=UPI0021AD634E|nr:hypothetical protein [Sphingomicrobium flavum]
MPIDPKVIAAENAAEAARAKLMHSAKLAIGEAKRRLAPDLLAKQAWKASAQAAKTAGEDVADGAVRFAKDKPYIVAGAVAAAALFLARKPVSKLAVDTYERLSNRFDEDEARKADDSLAAEAPNSPVAVARLAKSVAPSPRTKKNKPEVEKAK